MVAAWIKADTGVGPSMASGSQVYRGIWADFPVAPKNRHRVMAVRSPEPMGNLAARGKTSEKLIVPKVQKIRKTPNRNPKSPIRLTTKAFLPASDADFFSYQKPMSRYEHRPTPSQPTNMSRKLLAPTSVSMAKTKRLR